MSEESQLQLLDPSMDAVGSCIMLLDQSQRELSVGRNRILEIRCVKIHQVTKNPLVDVASPQI